MVVWQRAAKSSVSQLSKRSAGVLHTWEYDCQTKYYLEGWAGGIHFWLAYGEHGQKMLLNVNTMAPINNKSSSIPIVDQKCEGRSVLKVSNAWLSHFWNKRSRKLSLSSVTCSFVTYWNCQTRGGGGLLYVNYVNLLVANGFPLYILGYGELVLHETKDMRDMKLRLLAIEEQLNRFQNLDNDDVSCSLFLWMHNVFVWSFRTVRKNRRKILSPTDQLKGL